MSQSKRCLSCSAVKGSIAVSSAYAPLAPQLGWLQFLGIAKRNPTQPVCDVESVEWCNTREVLQNYDLISDQTSCKCSGSRDKQACNARLSIGFMGI